MSELLTTAALSVLLVSFGVGIVVGLTGMGGGALMTPALIFLGVNPTAAVANDLVAASVNKSVGATVHWRHGKPNLKLAGLLICASVPFAFAGAFIVKALGGSGGGKADLAQAGGRNESLLPGALKEAEAAVRETLAGGEAATGS